MDPDQLCALLKAGEWTLQMAYDKTTYEIHTTTKLRDAVIASTGMPLADVEDLLKLAGVPSLNVRLDATPSQTIVYIVAAVNDNLASSPYHGWPWQADPTEPL